MQAATQIDLARDEATPQEVLRSPLHATLITDTDNDTSSNASSDSASRTTQRSMRGGLATTGPPVRLIPKQSGARSSTTHGQINDPADGAGGDFCETDNSFELMPMDTGFGAWSYATAAFAMYIVVWGEHRDCLSVIATYTLQASPIHSRSFRLICRLDRKHNIQTR